MDDPLHEHKIDNSTLRLIRFKARQIAGAYGFRRDEFEDLEQTLILKCLERQGRFDPRRSGFRIFARIIVNNAVATMVESQKASCRDYRLCQTSLDAPRNELDPHGTLQCGSYDHDCATGGSGRVENDRIVKCDVERALALLPVELQQICRLLMVMDGIAEVAVMAGISRATLHRRMRMIRVVFTQAGLADYLPGAAERSRRGMAGR